MGVIEDNFINTDFSRLIVIKIKKYQLKPALLRFYIILMQFADGLIYLSKNTGQKIDPRFLTKFNPINYLKLSAKLLTSVGL